MNYHSSRRNSIRKNSRNIEMWLWCFSSDELGIFELKIPRMFYQDMLLTA